MNPKGPRTPKVGEIFLGPEIGQGEPVRAGEPGRYEVRAIVDAEEYEDGFYQVVFRYWTKKRGWRYEVVSSSTIAAGLYRKEES